jgi:hypothetical protein
MLYRGTGTILYRQTRLPLRVASEINRGELKRCKGCALDARLRAKKKRSSLHDKSQLTTHSEPAFSAFLVSPGR